MKATEFCKFFEFTIYKSHGIDEDGDEYNYIAVDDQGVFHSRYITDITEIANCFDSLLMDYIESNVEEDGFKYDDNRNGTYYEQLLEWLKEVNYYEWYIDVVSCLIDPRLIVDDVEEKWT